MKVPYLVPKVPSHYLPISKGFDSGINVTGPFTLHFNYFRSAGSNERNSNESIDNIREACLVI